MRPIHFPQQNVILAKDQPEYAALPAFRGLIPYHQLPGGHNVEEVIAAYRLTEHELETICKSKVVWVRQTVAVRGSLQPQLIQVENPFVFANGTIWDGKGMAEENWKKT